MSQGQRQQQLELTELLKRIVEECRQPSRLVELYYWSAEPELAEVMRQYIALPEEAQSALHAFLVLAAEDPGSVNVRTTAEGELILSSPWSAGLAKKIAEKAARPSAVH